MRLKFLVFLLTVSFAFKLGLDSKPKSPLRNKIAPTYKTMDPALAPIVDEYRSLAEKNDIKFTNTVTIGFTDIKYEDVVGICNYGKNFREIDIDSKYWKEITPAERKELVFHELSHCYCLRKHDYGENEAYPEVIGMVRSAKLDYFFIAPGYFIDGCPKSIMYPRVLSDKCFTKWEKIYESEMFDRCKPF